MERINCFFCKKITNEYHIFSFCNHGICFFCSSKLIFIGHLPDFQDNDVIQLQCKCKKQGSMKLNLLQILELLKFHTIIDNPTLKNHVQCINHLNMSKEIYCKDCQEYICEFCLKNIENKHSDHNCEIANSYVEKLRFSLKEIPMKFKTFEDFTANFDKIGHKFKEEFDNGFNSTINVIDDVIRILNVFRTEYSNFVKKRKLWVMVVVHRSASLLTARKI